MKEFWDKVIDFFKSTTIWISCGVILLGIAIWITLVVVESNFIKKA